MALTVAELRVLMTADTSPMRRGLAAVDQGAARTGRRFGALKKMVAGAVGAFALLGGARAVGNFFKSSVQGASDLGEEINKNTVIFGKHAAEILKWSKSSATAFGLSRRETLTLTGTFGDMFQQLGFTGAQATSMSKDIVRLSADLGSFNNLPTAQVAEMVSAAFRGEYDSLQRVIPGINAARVETVALNMTGKENAKTLTQQEKAAATLAIIEKDGARAKGDFKRTSDDLANATKILTAQYENAKDAIGRRLLPVITAFLAFLSGKAMSALRTAGNYVRDEFGPAFRAAGRFITGQLVPAAAALGRFLVDVVIPAVKATVGWFARHQDVTKVLAAGIAALVVVTKAHAAVLAVQAAGGLAAWLKGTKAATAATRVWTAVQWLLNAALRANPIGIVITLLTALVAGLVYAYRNSSTFRRIVDGALRAVAAAGRWMWNTVLKPTFDALAAALRATWRAGRTLARAMGNAWDTIRNTIATGVLFVVDKVLWMAEKLLGALAHLPGSWGDAAEGALNHIKGLRRGVNRELDAIRDEKVNVKVKVGGPGTGPTTVNRLLSSVGRAAGGPIKGPGSGRADLVPMATGGGLWMGSNGEHVFTDSDVRKAGGHDVMFAIRDAIQRGEFPGRFGDIGMPGHAEGGPVAHTSNPAGVYRRTSRWAHAYSLLLQKALQKQMDAVVDKALSGLGTAGKLTPAQVLRGQAFARRQVGDPYVWGGVGPHGFDCSGFVGAVLNAALGRNPYQRIGSTGTMPWGGFKPGPGKFTVGWFTGAPGHMAGNIGGMGIESAGGVGVRIGGAARGVRSFPRMAHFDDGGWLLPGITVNDTRKPEAVLTPEESAAWKGVSRHLADGGQVGSDDGGLNVEHLEVKAYSDRFSIKQVMDDLAFHAAV